MGNSGFENVPNIGEVLIKRLNEIGVHNLKQLKEMGTEKAFLKLRIYDPGACFSELCALEGAIENVRWHKLPKARKQELKMFFDKQK